MLIQQQDQSKLEKRKLLEETLLKQFPPNTQCVYYGSIGEKDSKGNPVNKFGNLLLELIAKLQKKHIIQI